MGATDGPPGGSSMPGGMPPYFTVSNHILSVKLKKPNFVTRDLRPIFNLLIAQGICEYTRSLSNI